MDQKEIKVIGHVWIPFWKLLKSTPFAKTPEVDLQNFIFTYETYVTDFVIDILWSEAFYVMKFWKVTDGRTEPWISMMVEIVI